MKTHIAVTFVALALFGAPAAFAQHSEHDHAGAPEKPQPPAATSTGTMGQMMQRMPDQCRVAMQNMPQSCMGMMRQMMGGIAPGAGQSLQEGSGPAHVRENAAAMDKMHGPMMDAASITDPDEAFVRGMIPHHQGAIDMAQIVLKYGKDEQSKKWANDVVREQTREIKEMEEWLQKRGK
jgi:uncharacterized protein (DUF305 family)